MQLLPLRICHFYKRQVVKATDNAHEIAVKKGAVFVMEEGQRETGRNVDVEEETAAAVEALEAGSWERAPPPFSADD
jgi:hypothetical protein